ncbi:MAG TPA: RNA 2',3'-cyclic phosphodiesterase [Clostridiales bacterium]|nr:RNA 2',3'-cyclic phosphodiesterase [Clostridiales bacterium]
MRLFVAIRFTPEVQNTLIDCIKELKSSSLSGNFTRPENLHLTLAFIGETSNLNAAKKCMDAISCGKFDITLKGFGRFGDLWWVGLAENPKLSMLVKDLQQRLRDCGFNISTRPFRPHITIAREVKTVSDQIHLNVPNISMTVDRISLMKSERIEGKLIYTQLYAKHL